MPNMTRSAIHHIKPTKEKRNTKPMQNNDEFPPLKNLSLTKMPKKVNIHIVIGEVTIIIFVIPNRVRPTYKCPIPKGRKSSRRNAVS